MDSLDLPDTVVPTPPDSQQVDKDLSADEAADLLKVSHPFLIGLLEEGALPFRLVGKHRRIRVEDLMTYKEDRANKRRKALDELSALGQEMDKDY